MKSYAWLKFIAIYAEFFRKRISQIFEKRWIRQ